MVRKSSSLSICIFAFSFPVIVAAIVLIFFTGCGSFGEVKIRQDVSKANHHNLEVEINKKTYHGIGVVPRSKKYEIKIKPRGNIARLRIETCHLKKVFDNPDGGFWNKAIEYDHTVMVGLEDKESCLMRITVLDNKKQENGFWIGDFLDTRPDVSGPALVKCNGKATKYTEGASICQASVGTYQGIQFENPHIFRAMKGCEDSIETKDGKFYEVIPVPGLCIYYFTGNKKMASGKWQKHRLTVYGVTDYPYEEVD